MIGNCPLSPDAPTFTDPFFIVTGRDPGEPVLRKGDSGGPLLATLQGTEFVVGVHPLPSFSFGNFHAPTFTLANANFISAQLGVAFPPSSDLDQDGVALAADNCPTDINPDQLDRDFDGRGDACDNCAPFHLEPEQGLDRYDGPTVTPEFLNPDQDDVSDEASSEQVILLDPSFEAQGDVAPLSSEAYFRGYAKEPLAVPCDSPMRAIQRLRKGNRCDPVPAARATITTAPIPQLPDFVACPKADGIGICNVEAPAGFDLDGAVRDLDAGTSGDVGLRLCPCSLPHATEADRRMHCAVGSLANCTIDAQRFVAPPLVDAAWSRLSLDTQAPQVDVLTPIVFDQADGQADGSVSWQSLDDLVLLTGEPLPPAPFSIAFDGTLAGGPVLDAIGWAFVRNFGGQSTAQLVDENHLFNPGDFDQPRIYEDHASYYFVGDHRFSFSCNCDELPQTKPPFPWEYCPDCWLLPEMHWINVSNPTQVLAVAPSKVRDVTRGFDPSAVALLLSGAERLPAAEPEYRMQQAEIPRRELLVDLSTLSVLGRLGIVGELVQALDRVVGEPRTPIGLEDADVVFPSAIATGDVGASCETFLAYSAVRDELFALVRAPSEAVRLGVWRGQDEQWHDMPLLFGPEPFEGKKNKTALCHNPPDDPTAAHTIEVGAGAVGAHLAHGDTLGACPVQIGEILALTFKLEHDALYVLEREPSKNRVRLLRIGLISGLVSVLAPKLLQGSYDRLALSAGYEGGLLLAAARTAGSVTRLAHLGVRDDEVTVVDRFETQDPAQLLAGDDARDNRVGAHYLTTGTAGFRPVVVPHGAFVTAAPGATANPVFP